MPGPLGLRHGPRPAGQPAREDRSPSVGRGAGVPALGAGGSAVRAALSVTRRRDGLRGWRRSAERASPAPAPSWLRRSAGGDARSRRRADSRAARRQRGQGLRLARGVVVIAVAGAAARSPRGQEAAAPLTMTEASSRKEGFKKCRSATFSIDGYSFTIGERFGAAGAGAGGARSLARMGCGRGASWMLARSPANFCFALVAPRLWS